MENSEKDPLGQRRIPLRRLGHVSEVGALIVFLASSASDFMTGGTALVESMHGAGSPQAQRVMIFREGQLDKKIRLAKALLGIPVKEARQ